MSAFKLAHGCQDDDAALVLIPGVERRIKRQLQSAVAGVKSSPPT